MSNPIERLDEISKLTKGWAFGQGVAFKAKVIAIARELILKGVETDNTIYVYPGREGHLIVSVYKNDDVLEFTILPDNSILWTLEINNIESDPLPISKKDALDFIQKNNFNEIMKILSP